MDDILRMMVELREAGFVTYEDQRARCVQILEEQAGCQCYDHENLRELLETIAANIDDETLSPDCLVT